MYSGRTLPTCHHLLSFANYGGSDMPLTAKEATGPLRVEIVMKISLELRMISVWLINPNVAWKYHRKHTHEGLFQLQPTR